MQELARRALAKQEQRRVPDLENRIENISRKVPTLDIMEHKLDMMHNLHPELKDIQKDLDDITDFSDMKAAKQGGQVIKRALDA